MNGTTIKVNGHKAVVGERFVTKHVCEHCQNMFCAVYWIVYDSDAWLWNPNLLRECEIRKLVVGEEE